MTISTSRKYNYLCTFPVIFNVGRSLVKSELRLPTPVSLSAAPPTKARVTMGNSPSDTFLSHALTSLSPSRSGIHNMLSAQTKRFAMHNMRSVTRYICMTYLMNNFHYLLILPSNLLMKFRVIVSQDNH